MQTVKREAVSRCFRTHDLPAEQIAACTTDAVHDLLSAQDCNLGEGWTVEGFAVSHPEPGKVLVTILGASREGGGVPALHVTLEGDEGETLSVNLDIAHGRQRRPQPLPTASRN